MDEMREQALRFGADLQMEDVESVALTGPVKEVVTAGGETYRARAVILAMGAAALPRCTREQELLGRGVSACATCDGFFFKGSGHRRDRRWRLRHGGGHLPDPLRPQRHPWCIAATSSAPPASCSSVPARTRRSPS